MGYYYKGDDYLSGSIDQKLKYQTTVLFVSKTCSNPEDRLHKNQKTKVILQNTRIFAMRNRYWGVIPEVTMALMLQPSLQGCIHGVFWNKTPEPVTVQHLC